MSEEEASDIDMEPRNRRARDRMHGATKAADDFAEWPWVKSTARLAMIALTVVLTPTLVWLGNDRMADFKKHMEMQDDTMQEIKIALSAAVAQRDDQQRQITQLWDRVFLERGN